jgi:hypothetical protein
MLVQISTDFAFLPPQVHPGPENTFRYVFVVALSLRSPNLLARCARCYLPIGLTLSNNNQNYHQKIRHLSDNYTVHRAPTKNSV